MDIPETVSLLNQERGNNQLYVSLVEGRPTYYSDDKTLPALPASVLNVLETRADRQPRAGRFARRAPGAARDSVRPGGQRKLFAQNHSKVDINFMQISRVFAALVCAAAAVHAVETKTWQQAEMADFEKGNLTRLSLASDGRLTLAPALKEIFDPSVTFLWAVARDSKGNLLRRRRRIGRIQSQAVEVDASGKTKTLAEFDGWRCRPSPSTGRIACMRRRRPTARFIAWTRPAKPKCFSIRKRNISGRWRFPNRAICLWRPATRERFIA